MQQNNELNDYDFKIKTNLGPKFGFKITLD